MMDGQLLMVKLYADSWAIVQQVLTYVMSIIYIIHACIQLVFQNTLFYCAGVSTYRSAHFGQGTGPIFMDDVACSGSELRLLDCSYDSDTSADSHSEDAGVRCQLC